MPRSRARRSRAPTGDEPERSGAEWLLEAPRRHRAEVVFSATDFCGTRMGRLRDPFGHLWIVQRVLQHLSHEEQQRCRDQLFARLAKQGSSLPPDPAP